MQHIFVPLIRLYTPIANYLLHLILVQHIAVKKPKIIKLVLNAA